MQITLNEWEEAFSFDMRAETAKDAAMIARVKMNGVKKVSAIGASFSKDGDVNGYVVIGKRKQPTSDLKG